MELAKSPLNAFNSDHSKYDPCFGGEEKNRDLIIKCCLTEGGFLLDHYT